MKSIEVIEDIICTERNITPSELHKRMSGRRLRGLNITRQIIMYFALKEGYTHTAAAGYFGLDHATCMHARDKINDYMLYDKKFNEQMEYYKSLLITDDPLVKTVQIKIQIDRLKTDITELLSALNLINV